MPRDAAVLAPDAPAAMDLLHAVPSIVAVSSTVANPAIEPHGIADGDLDTAWNSRTGDLTGAWIAFRLPADAKIEAIRMTPGFVAVTDTDDLFLMNHRIQRVRIVRWPSKEVLLEYTFDPPARGLHTIPLATGGGDIRIELAQLVPGTKPRWREAAISEIEVIGTAPDAVDRSHDPVIKVGSLDGKPVEQKRRIELVTLPAFTKLPGEVREAYNEIKWPHGWTATYHWVEPAPDRNVNGATFIDRNLGTCTLVIATPAGNKFVVGNLGHSCGGIVNGWCPGRSEATVQGPYVVLITSYLRYSNDFIPPDKIEDHMRVCTMTGDGLACSEPVTVGEHTCHGYGEGPPGADGLVVDSTAVQLVPTIKGKLLHLALGEAEVTPSEDLRDAIGPYLLVAP